MEENKVTNFCLLRGAVTEAPRFSHEARGERFYQFPLEVCRLSGATDTINVVVRQDLAASVEPVEHTKLCVTGELRSFNNKSGSGSKLVITVFAKELWFDAGEDENIIELTGTICKQPNLRVTPMGREICDLMLAVNRRYGRADYLPCIAWGTLAHRCAALQVGDSVRVDGRLQSRVYTKLTEDGPQERTAYEISALNAEILE